jgi:hypothetical protein
MEGGPVKGARGDPKEGTMVSLPAFGETCTEDPTLFLSDDSTQVLTSKLH